MSRDRAEAFATGTSDAQYWYSNDTADDSLTIVIEVAGNAEGGLMAYAWLSFKEPLAAHRWLDYTLPSILLGGIIVAILFCFFLPAKTLKKDSMLTLALFLLTLFMHYLTGVDFFMFTFRFLSLSTAHAPALRYITGILLGLINIFNLVSNRIIRLNRAEKTALFAVNATAFALYFLLAGTNFQFFAIAASLLSMLYILYKIAAGDQKFALVCINSAIHTALFGVLALETFDAEGWILFSSKVMFSIALFFILLAVIFINFYKMRENQKALLAAARLETEVAIMKNHTLKGQIKGIKPQSKLWTRGFAAFRSRAAGFEPFEVVVYLQRALLDSGRVPPRSGRERRAAIAVFGAPPRERGFG